MTAVISRMPRIESMISPGAFIGAFEDGDEEVAGGERSVARRSAMMRTSSATMRLPSGLNMPVPRE